MAFIFPEDKADFTAPNGVTYAWDGDKWVTKTFKADEAALANYVTTETYEDERNERDAVIADGLTTQREIQDDVATLNNRLDALDGSTIDAVWTFEQDDRIPRGGEFALRTPDTEVTNQFALATLIIFNATDENGVTWTFENVTVGDVIRLRSDDNGGAGVQGHGHCGHRDIQR